MHEVDRALIAQMGLQDIVATRPFVSHREAIDHLLSADVLLLLIAPFPGSQGMYTGKLFDYLGARKPILALVTEGLAADLIRKLEVGVIVHPENIEDIRKAIMFLYEKYRNSILQPIDASVRLKRFEHRELTRHLAEVFEDVLEKA
jgi:glycosyltransferase involved in cell wall biosynthesis